MSELLLTRSPASKKGDYITRAQAEQIVAEVLAFERQQNEQMVQWYMRQIPGLVAQMLGDAFAANGLTFAPPALVKPDATKATAASDEVSENTGEYLDESATEPAFRASDATVEATV